MYYKILAGIFAVLLLCVMQTSNASNYLTDLNKIARNFVTTQMRTYYNSDTKVNIDEIENSQGSFETKKSLVCKAGFLNPISSKASERQYFDTQYYQTQDTVNILGKNRTNEARSISLNKQDIEHLNRLLLMAKDGKLEDGEDGKTLPLVKRNGHTIFVIDVKSENYGYYCVYYFVVNVFDVDDDRNQRTKFTSWEKKAPTSIDDGYIQNLVFRSPYELYENTAFSIYKDRSKDHVAVLSKIITGYSFNYNVKIDLNLKRDDCQSLVNLISSYHDEENYKKWQEYLKKDKDFVTIYADRDERTLRFTFVYTGWIIEEKKGEVLCPIIQVTPVFVKK